MNVYNDAVTMKISTKKGINDDDKILVELFTDCLKVSMKKQSDDKVIKTADMCLVDLIL